MYAADTSLTVSTETTSDVSISLNKTPAKAFTSPAEEKQCITSFIHAGLSR